MPILVESVQHPAAAVLRVHGRVDGENAAELEDTLFEWITPDQRNLILDLTELQYISSAGLSSILSAGKRIDGQDGMLLVCGLSPRLRQLFEFSGFDSLFPVFRSPTDALADCAERSRNQRV